MPNGPIDGLIFAHNAIDAEARRIEAEAHRAATPEAAAALANDAAFLSKFVAAHTDGEELGLYPVLIEKEPNIDKTFLFDHADDKQQFADLLGLVERCKKEGDGAALTSLRRQTVAMTEHLALHIRKENEIVLPMVGKHFSPPEQVDMVQKILSLFTPEDMAKVVPFITKLQTPEGSVAYVKVLSQAMPPPVFEKAKGWIASGVPEDRLAHLKTALPDLSL